MNLNDCYSREYNKLEECKKCKYKSYCKASFDMEKKSIDNTQKDNFDIPIQNIFDQQSGSNFSGFLISELLKLTKFNPITFFVVICRLGGLTFKEISDQIGVSDVAVFQYFNKAHPVIKKYIKTKKIVFIELKEAFKNRNENTLKHKIFNKSVKQITNDNNGEKK